MKCLKSVDIENGLKALGRIYLCGNLKKENGVWHLKTDGYEIGISDYPVYTFEKPHIHSYNTEYNYVLEGAIKILLIAEKKEYLFTKGDLFAIETGEPYVGKALPGTRTIFSKVPGGDDKVLVEMKDACRRWGASWESAYEEGESK